MEKMAEICCGGYEDAPAAYRGGAGFCCKKADFAGMKKMQRFCFPIGRVTRRQMKYL